MTREIPLHQLAHIKSGYSLRNPLENTVSPNVLWVQPNNVISKDFSNLPPITVKLAKNITLLQEGDVLLTNRSNFKAACFKNQGSMPALASAAVWIIRPYRQYLNPAFLTFWFNSEQGQKALYSLVSEFTTLKFIRKEDIQTLYIPVPPLAKQEQFAALYTCYIKQKYLQDKKFNLQQKLLNALSAQI